MSTIRFSQLVTLVCVLVFSQAAEGAGRSASERYFDLFDQGLAFARTQMPVTIASADQAARRLVAGATIYIAGSQDGFVSEASGRAGGLMCLKTLDKRGKQKLGRGDIVLFGAPAALTTDDLRAVGKWRADGAYVIAFAHQHSRAKDATSPDMVIRNGGPLGLTVTVGEREKLCPVDTVVNVINLWSWMGELTAACTRLGKMPVLYQSYLIAGGIERGKKYAGKTFHDDLAVTAIPPGVLGRAYMDAIEAEILGFRNGQMPSLVRAAQWWRSAEAKDRATVAEMGHMFPQHFLDTRAPQMPAMQRVRDRDSLVKTAFPADGFVFFCGYRHVPEKLIARASAVGFKLVYLTVEPARSDRSSDNVIHLRSGWPVTDACVIVPGYDVPILPASGVVNAAVYWALLAEVCSSDR